MQTANVLVSLGGDHGNTVPKYGVTAAEIAVLRAIHGDDAVNDVEPSGDVKRSHRDERGRLLAIYGAAKDDNQKPIVEGMFPGVAARVFETIAELDLDESMFKATGRLKAVPAVTAWELDIVNSTKIDTAEIDDADEAVGEDMTDEHAEKPAENILG
jgi:hypothetical protein